MKELILKMKNYIDKIKEEKYDYEYDEIPCLQKLEEDIQLAREKMKRKNRKIQYKIENKCIPRI